MDVLETSGKLNANNFLREYVAHHNTKYPLLSDVKNWSRHQEDDATDYITLAYAIMAITDKFPQDIKQSIETYVDKNLVNFMDGRSVYPSFDDVVQWEERKLTFNDPLTQEVFTHNLVARAILELSKNKLQGFAAEPIVETAEPIVKPTVETAKRDHEDEPTVEPIVEPIVESGAKSTAKRAPVDEPNFEDEPNFADESDIQSIHGSSDEHLARLAAQYRAEPKAEHTTTTGTSPVKVYKKRRQSPAYDQPETEDQLNSRIEGPIGGKRKSKRKSRKSKRKSRRPKK